MENNSFIRTEALIGKDKLNRLSESKVAVFGVGGVGSFTAEALVRSGLGEIILIDYDIIDISNINRQIHANTKTIGMAKVEVMRSRLLDINPDLNITIYKEKYNEDTRGKLLKKDYDYIVDAIDMVSSKLDLITSAKEMGIKIISSMGAGNKLSPTMLRIGDIYETSICPLAKVMRRELRKRKVDTLKVIWSPEIPIKPIMELDANRRASPGSVSFVPSVAGLIIASEVVKDLIN